MGAQSSSSMSSFSATAATAKKTSATVIFLHGLGDTGDGWLHSLQSLRIPHVNFVCPTAPEQPVTLNGGMRMTAWFDLKSLDVSGNEEDEDGIKRAAEQVHKMIEDEEKRGTSSDRIILGGFSQGGALALYSAFRFQRPLAGVIALSCWVPLHKTFPQAAVGNRETPIIQCHGDGDFIVPLQWGVMSNEVLKTFAKNINFRKFSGLGHCSCPEEMDDVRSFILKYLPSI